MFTIAGDEMITKLALDNTVYSVDVIQKAAYSLIDRLVVLIISAGDTTTCEIEPTAGHEASFEIALQDFKRELLDHSLRAKIKSETEPMRNLVLAYAFSRTRLQG